jgi:hypothetical protein
MSGIGGTAHSLTVREQQWEWKTDQFDNSMLFAICIGHVGKWNDLVDSSANRSSSGQFLRASTAVQHHPLTSLSAFQRLPKRQ